MTFPIVCLTQSFLRVRAIQAVGRTGRLSWVGLLGCWR